MSARKFLALAIYGISEMPLGNLHFCLLQLSVAEADNAQSPLIIYTNSSDMQKINMHIKYMLCT